MRRIIEYVVLSYVGVLKLYECKSIFSFSAATLFFPKAMHITRTAGQMQIGASQRITRSFVRFSEN